MSLGPQIQILRGSQVKSADQIGGAVVRRAFRMGERFLFANTKLTPEEVFSINPANRVALINNGMLVIWPRGNEVAAPAAVKAERFMVHTGGGRYDVIEGRRVNEASLSREEAQAMTEDKPH